METQTASSRDVYGIITDKIIEQLEHGIVPWKQPWKGDTFPRNLISKNRYRGINAILLASLGYSSNYFLTYRQVMQLEGSIKSNENPHLVVYLKFPEYGKENTGAEKGEKPRFRYYKVYNVMQCEGLSADLIPEEITEIRECEELVEAMPIKPEIKHAEPRAFYDPVRDYVNMPAQNSFDSSESYYATLFHELVHSTGHISRLNRKDLIQMAEFGSEPYSHEELVAEIGSWFLQSYTGITGEAEQSVAYISGWIAKLRNDKRFIFTASNHAQKATDFILNAKDGEDQS